MFTKFFVTFLCALTLTQSDPNNTLTTLNNGSAADPYAWTKTVGGSFDDAGGSVIETSDGNFVVTGYTESYGAVNNDLWLLKFSSEGDLLWAKYPTF